VGSSYLDTNDLEKEGIGYDIGLAIFHDITLSTYMALRIGIRADFHSYSYTTDFIYTPPDTVVTQYPIDSRDEDFYFGVEIGASYELTPRLVIAFAADIVFDVDLTPYLRPKLRLVTTQ